MKNIHLESWMTGMNRLVELFNYILENSNYNLNQFVKSDTLAISDDVQEDFIDALKELIDIAPGVVRDLKDKEKFWASFEQLDDYKNNSKFIKWLIKYTDAVRKPFEDAAFMREMSDTVLQEMSEYCFQNLIMKNIGKKRVDKKWDIRQITILRKIMFTFIEMVIINNFSKENTFFNIQRLFGVKESQCELWWEMVKKNEERLWRIMLMKKYSQIESKLDIILENIDEYFERQSHPIF